ncbi:unnamed protein product, partial [Ectocarpus sp. 12 AP-2014]
EGRRCCGRGRDGDRCARALLSGDEHHLSSAWGSGVFGSLRVHTEPHLDAGFLLQSVWCRQEQGCLPHQEDGRSVRRQGDSFHILVVCGCSRGP